MWGAVRVCVYFHPWIHIAKINAPLSISAVIGIPGVEEIVRGVPGQTPFGNGWSDQWMWSGRWILHELPEKTRQIIGRLALPTRSIIVSNLTAISYVLDNFNAAQSPFNVERARFQKTTGWSRFGGPQLIRLARLRN